MASPKLEPVVLTDEERQVLEGWARRRKTAQALALRSRIILGCADGGSVSGDRKLKESTPRLAPGRPQPPTMGFDNRTADHEAHAHAVGLRRVEWLEQATNVLFDISERETNTLIASF